MDKEALRKEYRAKRKALSEEALEQKSEHIARNFIAFLEQRPEKPTFLHIFLPIRKNREVDTWKIIHHLRKEEPEVNIVSPKSDLASGDMINYLLGPDTKLEENKLRIPEPVNAEKVDDSKIDMVLLPLLAYDKQGDRVGYGAGFYDKFLERCSSDTLKVGVSFFGPIDKILDVGEHDIVLDHCITPEKTHSFPS